MKEVYIFDIDGCILPQVFPTITENSTTNESVIKESLERSKKVSLYDSFVSFYEKSCKNAYYVVFITGRQKSHFSKITERQLSPLKKSRTYDIIYYPEDKEHVKEDYFNWKLEKIKEVFDEYKINGNLDSNSRNDVIFKIFDDRSGYFLKVKKTSKSQGLNIVLKAIRGSKDWMSIN